MVKMFRRTAEGMRIRRIARRKEEARLRAARAVALKTGKTVKDAAGYTAEEIGWPPKEIENEPHPDNPNFTRAQWFVKQHGQVHLMPAKERKVLQKQGELTELSAIIRDFGKAVVRDLSKIDKDGKLKSLSIVECLETLAIIEDGQRDSRIKYIAAGYNDIKNVWRLVEPFGALIEEHNKAVAG
jgi:hypothetical protein